VYFAYVKEVPVSLCVFVRPSACVQGSSAPNGAAATSGSAKVRTHPSTSDLGGPIAAATLPPNPVMVCHDCQHGAPMRNAAQHGAPCTRW
jgi:hypothetical protein